MIVYVAKLFKFEIQNCGKFMCTLFFHAGHIHNYVTGL